jgi:hypothetical protein
VTISMLRSRWRSTFLTYKGAFTTSRSTLFWKGNCIYRQQCAVYTQCVYVFHTKLG